jgi:NAD(P)-dependent dehydrogenase (short-subunit alcohol dehydrogenase family)
MTTLSNEKILITGGSRGVGFAIATALLKHGAQVTVVARDRQSLCDVASLGACVIAGDATSADLMDRLVAEIQPSVLILNAGTKLAMASIFDQSWGTFSAAWNADVKAGLHGIQAALKAPMPRGSRVLIMSSGAAMVLGVPYIPPRSLRLSGGYVGAKRMLWLMAHHANAAAEERSLDLNFQVLAPLQLMAETELGREVAAAYSAREGISTEEYILARYGKPLSPRQIGEQVVTLLAEPRYAKGVAYGFKSEADIIPLDV